MSIYSDIPYIEEDRRVRRFIQPRAVVETAGDVKDPQNLLVKQHLQVGFGETCITKLRNGADGEHASVILDFGVELHGGLRIINFDCTYSLINETRIFPMVRLTFGESLAEAKSTLGDRNASNNHSVRQMEVVVPQLSDQMWGQTGFRFVKVELLTPESELQIKTLVAVSIMHDYEYKGSFECDDERINRIYETAAYTCHLCLQNMVWDGIKRDRLVWIGDMMPETMTVHNIFGTVPVVEKSLDFSRETTKLPRWMNDIPSYSMWWIMILRDWYMASGDKVFLERQMDYLKKLLLQLGERVNSDGTVRFHEWNILDWPSNDNMHFLNGIYSLMKMSLISGAYLLRVFGDEETALWCEECAYHITTDGETGDLKQVAAFMSLGEMLDKDKAAEQILKGGDTGLSTFLSYFLFKALSIAGHDEEAISMLRSYYGYMLDKGATSFWEDFQKEWAEGSGNIYETPAEGLKDIHRDYGRYCYVGLIHSYCHGWSSGPVPYLAERVLGVNIVEPGCKTLEIKPHLGGLKWVKGTFPTPYGPVKIHHTVKADGTVDTKVDAPQEIKIIL
ncbi:MAG: alpha-L-rhamnosidase [Clostridia bacterium]|nr:alpha-L-rhamnosidase [Clostridia bacterium]